MGRARGARTAYRGAFESNYGIPPVSGYMDLPYAGQSLSQTQALLENEILGYGRDQIDPIGDAIDVAGDATIPIDPEAFGFWLKGAFGAPTTTEDTGVYTHVFESGSWAIPSMSLEAAFPDIPRYEMFAGVKVDQLSFSLARKGLLQGKVMLKAQGMETPTTTSAAGTSGAFGISRFGNYHGAIKRDGVALGSVVSAELTYSNELDPVETIRNDGKIDGLDESIAKMTGKLVMRFDSPALLDQAINGTACALQFGLTKAADASLTFDMPRVFLPQPSKSVDGPGGIQVTFDWQAAVATNGDPMVTVTLINTLAGY